MGLTTALPESSDEMITSGIEVRGMHAVRGHSLSEKETSCIVWEAIQKYGAMTPSAKNQSALEVLSTTYSMGVFIEKNQGDTDNLEISFDAGVIFQEHVLRNLAQWLNNIALEEKRNELALLPRVSRGWKKDYTLKQEEEVERFVSQHPDVKPLLAEAPQVIRRYFGDKVPLVLKVFQDPEGGSGEELFISIQTKLSPKRAVKCLDKLDDDSWLNDQLRATPFLNITIECI